MTESEYKVTMALADAGRPLSANELGLRTHLARTTIRDRLAELVAEGKVIKVDHHRRVPLYLIP
jgi:DNA-binding GntR family transcriptional regulator